MIDEPSEREIEVSLARDSFAWFLRVVTPGFRPHRWQREFLVPLLEGLGRGEGRRILIHAPPQVGKSLVISRRYAAWRFGRDPGFRYVTSAYNLETAVESFGEPIRDLMRSDEYREIFPEAALGARASAKGFSTPLREGMRDGQESFTALGMITGFTGKGLFGRDLFVGDDPYPSPEIARSEAENARVLRFWPHNADHRVRNGADALFVYHRYHPNDLGGALLATGKWEHYRLPAIADDGADDPTHVANGGWRERGDPLSPLLTREKCREVEEGNPLDFAGLYQGLPKPEAGGLIRPEAFATIAGAPSLTTFARCWDLATSEERRNDDTASAFGGIEPGGRLAIGEVERFRLEWPEARARIVQTAIDDLAWCESRGAELLVGVETFGQQGALLSDLRRLEPFLSGRARLVGLRPKGDKRQKASRWAANAPLGLVAVCPTGFRRPWDVTGAFSEFRAFSGAPTDIDNRVDAVSLLNHLLTNRHGELQDESPNPILRRLRREHDVYHR